MIDAREEILSPAPKAAHRRTAKISTAREIKPQKSAVKKSLRIERVFSDAKIKPFDQIEWDKRTAEITDDANKVIFKQENVEVPKSWSVLATKVVVSKYFYGEQNTSERETSVRQLIARVVDTIVTEMAYIRVTERGLVLEEVAPGLTAEDVQRATEARLIVSDNLKVMES